MTPRRLARLLFVNISGSVRPGAKVLYLGAASGTSVSHVADIVGPAGTVYAVEFSHRSGRDLINMATHRTNVIPIIEDARHPLRYRMLVTMVDVIFADVAQPDQARIVGLNAHLYLKVGGGVVVSVKANCIDSTAAPEAVFAREVQKMKEERIKPFEQLTLEPFERGEYRGPRDCIRLTVFRSLHCDWQICALYDLNNVRVFKREAIDLHAPPASELGDCKVFYSNVELLLQIFIATAISPGPLLSFELFMTYVGQRLGCWWLQVHHA